MDKAEERYQSIDLVESYRRTLEQSFGYYLKECVNKDDPSIVSVGSGFGFEVGALQKIFPNMSYLGIEKDEKYLKAAQKINRDVQGNIQFITANAKDPQSFGDNKWDMVLIRHPQVHESYLPDGAIAEDWRVILNNSAQTVTESGVIIVTSDTEEEIATASKILVESGINILVNEKNKFPSEGPHNDSFIMIGKKHAV